jgi:acylphosphatase
MSIERRRALYSGRVQGVGFRYTTHRLAQGHAVSGYVRNLPDGRVEVVAEGEPTVVGAFFDAITREFAGNIREAEIQTEPSDRPSLTGFTIRF